MSSVDAQTGYAAIAEFRKTLKKPHHASIKLKKPVNSKSKSNSHHLLVDPAKYGKYLSDVLSNSSCNNDFKKANLSGKFIAKIDAVEARFRNLESILLGNNDLKCLNGIEQFPCLRSLSLVNNLIEDFGHIQALQKLPHLEVLHVEGCPLTRRPNYVAYLVSTIPTLRKLDSIIISRQDRDIAQTSTVKQKSMVGIMIANETTIRIVQSLQCKIRLHMDLIQTAFGRNRIFNRTDFKPSHLHQLNLNEAVKILGFTQDPNREEIRAEMIRRVEMVWRSTYEAPGEVTSLGLITQSWDYALSEAMAIQQERLASAISSAEIARCQAQSYIKVLIKKRRYPAGDFLRPTLQSELKNKHPRSFSLSPKRKTVKFLQDQLKKSRKTQQNDLDSAAPVPFQTIPISEPPPAGYQTQANQAPARNGQQRIIELESLNLKLIRKLQQFQQQNHENVLQAEADAQKWSSHVEKLSMSLKDLQQQIQFYRCDRDRYQAIVSVGISPDSARTTFVNKITELEQLLENNQKELTECKCELENERKKLQEKDEQIQRCSLIHQFRGPKTTRERNVEGLTEDETGEANDSHLIGVYLSVESLCVNNRLRTTFKTWKSRIGRKHALLGLKNIAGQNIKAQIWLRWVSSLSCVQYRKLLKKRRHFRQWRQLLSKHLKRRQEAVVMTNLQQRRSVRHSWHLWRLSFSRNRQCRITPDIKANEFHASFIIRSMFNHWRLHIINIARPWRQKNLASKYFRLIRCISKFWSLWKEALMAAKVDHSRYRLANIHYQCKLERQAILLIRQHAVHSNRKKNMNQLSYHFRTHNFLKRWHTLMKIRSHWDNVITEKRSQWNFRRLSVLFNCWLARWRLCTKEVQALNQTRELDKLRSIKSAYFRWRQMLLVSRAFRISNSARILSAKNRNFQEWSRITLYRVQYRENQIVLVTRVLEATKRYQLKNAFRRMIYFCQSELHYQFVSTVIGKRRSWKLVRCSFHQWLTSWLLKLLTTLRASLNDANSRLSFLQIERENISSDAVRLSDTVTRLRDTVLQQSLAMASKDSAFESVQIAHDKLEDQIEAMTEKEDVLLRKIHMLEAKCQTGLNEKELLSIRYKETEEDLIKMQLDLDTAGKRHSNVVRAIEAVLTESMIVLVSSKFRSAETLKEWIQQIIRHLQHMLYSGWNEPHSQTEASNLNQLTSSQFPCESSQKFSEDIQAL